MWNWKKEKLIMSSEDKKVTLELKDGKLLIQADLNKDGEAIVTIAVDLSEVADEVIDLIKAKSTKE